MTVLRERLETPRQGDAARLIAVQLEGFAVHTDNLAGEHALALGRQRRLETAPGIGVGFLTADAIAPRQILRGADHIDGRRRIEHRLPEEVLELHSGTETETATMGVGGDRGARR